MKDYYIRPATIEDMSECVKFMKLLGHPMTLEALEARFEAFMAMDGYGTKLVCLGDEIVGCIAWSQAKLFVTNLTRFHIEVFIVKPEHRGKGLGQKLLHCVEEVAEQHRPSIIDLTSGIRHADEETDEFYQSLGYNNQGPLKKIIL